MTILNKIFHDPRPQFEDANGAPLDLGSTLTFYSAGTTTPKAIYADSSLDTPLDNPLTLDAGGYVPEGGVWLAEGSYKLVVKNSLGATEWTQDNIAGSGLSGGGSSAFGYVESIADLRNITPDSIGLAYVTGYYGSGTGGNKFFYWSTSSTATDDGGSIIAPQGTPATGRWVALWSSPYMTLEDWGCRTGATYSNATAVENMVAFANINPLYECVFGDGDWYLNGNVDVDGDISVTVRNGCRFRGTTGVHTLTFSCLDLTIETEGSLGEPFPSSLLTPVITSEITIDPRWFSATEGVGNDSSLPFGLVITNSGTNPIEIKVPFFIDDIDFTGRTLVKSNTGLLDIGSLGATFQTITADGTFIDGDFSALSFLENKVIGDWFDLPSPVDSTIYSNLMSSLASNGSKFVSWLEGSYEFDTAMSNDDTYKHSFDISPNVLFKATGVDVFMGNVVSSNHCIDNTQTGRFLFNQDVKLQWFGASPSEPTQTSRALLQAVEVGSFIDGGGSSYAIDESIDVGVNSFLLKNTTLVPTAVFTGTKVIVSNGAMDFRNVTIDSTGNLTLVLIENIIDSSTLNFKDCVFSGKSIDIKGQDNKISLVGVDFSLAFTIELIQKTAIFSRCSFYNLVIWDPNAVRITDCNILSTGGYAITFISIITIDNNKELNVIENNYFDNINTSSFFQLTKTNGTQVIGQTDPLDLLYWLSVPLRMVNNSGTDQATEYQVSTTVSLAAAGTFDVNLTFPTTYDRQYIGDFFNDGKYIPSISPFGSGITDITYFRRFSNPQVITMRYTVATAGAGATQDVLTYTGRARYSTI